jgi:glycosyltransferase involved in cell wall biosynthesis
MKIALVHELLTMRGGAERLFKTVADMFPEAPIYTLLYNKRKLGDWFPKNRVRTSGLQNTPPFSTNHHKYLRRFPKATEKWDFSEFDLVISFSSAFVHGIKTSGKTKHICYVNTPARYLWDQTNAVQERAGKGILGPLRKLYLDDTFHRLRQWDCEAADRPDKILAASKTVQRRVEQYWRRESRVLYPPVDVSAFPVNTGAREDYYVVASTLVPYKRIRLAIEACNALGRTLKIAGEGPHKKALEKMAGPTVEFLGYVHRDQLVPLLQNARAFIFPGEEDFGIAPLEAMACGTPVIAYGQGGALETIHDKHTGEFFTEPTAESLIEAIKELESRTYVPEACHAQAIEFSTEKFREGLRKYVDNF